VNKIQCLSYLFNLEVRKVPATKYLNTNEGKGSKTVCDSDITDIYINLLKKKARGN
jgi:hypothetical protein